MNDSLEICTHDWRVQYQHKYEQCNKCSAIRLHPPYDCSVCGCKDKDVYERRVKE